MTYNAVRLAIKKEINYLRSLICSATREKESLFKTGRISANDAKA